MKHVMTKIMCTVLLVAGLCGCEKFDISRLEGAWHEQYDPTVFAMDASVMYSFDGNGHYNLHIVDLLGGNTHDDSGSYVLDRHEKTITLIPDSSDGSRVTYCFVKLTAGEMEWQKKGTTYAVGTWGSDYRHFVKFEL